MSFGLAKGRDLDPSGIALSDLELPPLPDSIATDPEAGRLDPTQWFPEVLGRSPLEIEIGCGKGTFLIQQAALQPETRFFGMEWAREFFVYAADRVRRHGLANVRMANTDAGEFFRWRLGPGIASVVHLYFPDPWPKRKHNRRRIVQEPFLRECWRVLQPAGELRIVTDHPEYWAWMEDEFATVTLETGAGLFERLPFDRPESAGEGELVGTNFERKYRREGRPFHATLLRKISPRTQG